MTEIRLGDHLLAFDGKVLEVFGHEPGGESARYHAALIETILLARDARGQLTLNFSTRHGGILGLKVPPEKKPEVEALVQGVEQAKAACRSEANP
jgi:hypothetical protein